MYEELVKSLREATGWKNASIHYSLMKEAADAIETLNIECKQWKERGDALEKALNVAFSDFAKIMENRSWVSVTERLPKKYESVWTYSKFGMLQDEYIGEYDGENYFARQTTHVTHWMPLPEPPKGET